jgi:hypothetical protein
MAVAAADDLSMILPLPLPPNAPDDAIRFVNLESYPHFFDDLDKGFPQPPPAEPASLLDQPVSVTRSLPVHEVGQFEASFVPTLADFGRLDPLFRLPETTWEQLPLYRDWGFAVFQLKAQEPGRPLGALEYFDESTRGPLAGVLLAAEALFSRAEGHRRRRFHPMAFEFPRREPGLLYFPTVHIHDGQVHPYAHFDHHLYCQPDAELLDELSQSHGRVSAAKVGWERSDREAGGFIDRARSQDTIAPQEPVYRLVLRGDLPNEDVTLRKNGKWTRGDYNAEPAEHS